MSVGRHTRTSKNYGAKPFTFQTAYVNRVTPAGQYASGSNNHIQSPRRLNDLATRTVKYASTVHANAIANSTIRGNAIDLAIRYGTNAATILVTARSRNL